MIPATSAPLTVDLAAWPGVVLHVAPDGEVLASNGKLDALLGTDIVGRAITDLLDPESSLRKWQRLGKTADPSTETWELVFCTNARALEPGAYSILPAPSSRGLWLVEQPAPRRLTELAAEVSDINSELSTAQRALVIERARLASALAEVERSNRALDEFAHAVSHDLKAPLRAIADYADVVVTQVATPDKRDGYLRRITELAGRMREMIDAALQYARAGRPAERYEHIDTGEVLRGLVSFLAPPSEVRIDIAPDMPVLETARVPFEQVFRNLLANAVNYRRPDEPRVDVAAHDVGDAYEFIVADNGPGIPESQQERIWRLFHTSRPGVGTGLGLALVKRLVEAHGGSVGVRSADGHGAAFHVRWPKRPVRAPSVGRA